MPYGNCATVLLPGEIADGVLIIPEVRTAVKENLLEIFRDSLGPRSTAIDYRRCGPAGPAIMAHRPPPLTPIWSATSGNEPLAARTSPTSFSNFAWIALRSFVRAWSAVSDVSMLAPTSKDFNLQAKRLASILAARVANILARNVSDVSVLTSPSLLLTPPTLADTLR